MDTYQSTATLPGWPAGELRQAADEHVASLVEAGFVEPIPQGAAIELAAGSPPPLATDTLDALTVAQLRAHAEERGIDLAGLDRKADLVAAIEAAGTPPVAANTGLESP